MQCVQSGFVPCIYKSCAANFKAVEGTFVARYVSDKRCVLISLVFILGVYVLVEWHCKFKNVQGFVLNVLNNVVWFELCHTEGR